MQTRTERSKPASEKLAQRRLSFTSLYKKRVSRRLIYGLASKETRRKNVEGQKRRSMFVYVCEVGCKGHVRVEIANVKCGARGTGLSGSGSGHFVFFREFSKCFWVFWFLTRSTSLRSDL